MRSYRYFHLDVFTDRLFGGNQLAVFLDARGLTSVAMQAIAKEMNFAESAFVLPTALPGVDCDVRIFTPDRELPMAGHPTIGTAFAMARAGIFHPGQGRIVFGLGVGPTPVALNWVHGALNFAWMTQRSPSFGPPIADAAGCAAFLRLPTAAVAGTGLPAQVISCGAPFLLVPLTSRRAVDNASLDTDGFEVFRKSTGVDDLPVFVFSSEPGPEHATVYSRCLAPQFPAGEDAATGGASGPLGCYLVQHKIVPAERAGSMLSLQGVKMGRPSHVYIAIGLSDAGIAHVCVGGHAIVAGEGTLYV
jgi:trans-2,3-dihydro-3-hydroxyanthranilate isomerase